VDDDGDGQADCAMAAICGKLLVNEINYDNPGPDNAEFVEIVNAGAGPVDLAGVSLALVNGAQSPPPAYATIDLSGNVLAAGQYLVVGTAGLTIANGALKVDLPGNVTIQNGASGSSTDGDAVALFDGTYGVVLDALSYEAPVLGANIGSGTYDLFESPNPPPASILGESPNAPETSIIRFPNAGDTGDDTVDFRLTPMLTPGAANLAGEVCNDGVDDDGDGQADCADADCAADPSCVEVCNDGIDNNNDTQIDCQEASCDGMTCGMNGLVCASGACACPGGAMEMSCGDGMDDDCDGLVDCDDPDCAASLLCSENCSNGADDNGDSLADCADPLCESQSCGPNGLTCSSGVCACPGGTTESACGDVTDNDCDGLVDCVDPDCASEPSCMLTGTLIFSEYVEGTMTRKALEIFNATGQPYDMAAHGCVVHRYTNAATMPGATIDLTGTLAADDTYVLCNPMSVQPGDSGGIPAAQCDIDDSAINHNGNDSYDLTCDGAIVDFIGQIGGSSANFAADVTLRRVCTVTTGHTMTSSMFNAAEWTSFPVDTFTGLDARSCPNDP
jgi:hypothetical protein